MSEGLSETIERTNPTDRSRLSRARAKRMGGKVIAFRRYGEITQHVWKFPDGSLWSGDDWYNDVDALVWPGAYDWYEEGQK